MAVKEGTLGAAIRAARIRIGYTQEQLAELLNITPGHLQHMESGRRNPSVPMLFQLMELLDLSVDALVFQARGGRAVHLDGLSEGEQEAVIRLVDAMKTAE